MTIGCTHQGRPGCILTYCLSCKINSCFFVVVVSVPWADYEVSCKCVFVASSLFTSYKYV